jgi:hypothetical protein
MFSAAGTRAPFTLFGDPHFHMNMYYNTWRRRPPPVSTTRTLALQLLQMAQGILQGLNLYYHAPTKPHDAYQKSFHSSQSSSLDFEVGPGVFDVPEVE